MLIISLPVVPNLPTAGYNVQPLLPRNRQKKNPNTKITKLKKEDLEGFLR